jgi:two-component system response regulator RpfG
MKGQFHPQGVVVVLDDHATSRAVLATLVASVPGVEQVVEQSSPFVALAYLRQYPVDLVFVDYKMPGMNGIEFIRCMRLLPDCRDVPIIMVTSSLDSQVRLQALESGATDFLTKPVDHAETRARARNLLRLREQQCMLEWRAQTLERRVASAVQDIRLREHETLMRLARAGEYRDEQTGNHILRMARYSRTIAEGLGLSADECHQIEMASPMHDVGKIGIPDRILRKPGQHNPEEAEIMRQHTVIGYNILKDSPSAYLQLGAKIALSHHERYDGSGYPYALRGEAIPLPARIVAVADVFDALTTLRPYKPSWSTEAAMNYIQSRQNSHFDPACVAVFQARFTEVLDIHRSLQDADPVETRGQAGDART